jgi:hypothetical protein
MFQLELCLLLVAVVSALLLKLLPREKPSPSGRLCRTTTHKPIPVLIASPLSYDWQAAVWDLLSKARYPKRVTVHVLVECRSSESDAIQYHLDPELRPFVRVSHAPLDPSENPHRKVRRLHRRFPTDVDTVLLTIPSVRLVCGWDIRLDDHLRSQLKYGVVTAAASAHQAAFPTLRISSEGKCKRGEGKSYAHNFFDSNGALVLRSLRGTVPSVCWCPEFTLATPAQLDAWPKARDVSSCVDLTRTQVVVFPLLEPSSKVEDDALDSDVGSGTRACTECSLRGLTETPRADEATLKCGSVRAARLVKQFSHRR